MRVTVVMPPLRTPSSSNLATQFDELQLLSWGLRSMMVVESLEESLE